MPGNAPGRMSDWQRTDRLFSACLELSDDERDALLARDCATDPGLRARVEALLAASQREDLLLARRDALVGGLFPLDNADGLVPGTHLGDYRIERLIGEGGMARVYLAEQKHPDWRRKVAIKVLKVASGDLLARFHAERRILAGLEHPGIARLIDAGATPDDQPYLVTEFIEGEPIHQYCRQRNLSVQARLDLFLQLADAVQHAHSRLVVHRDIKPSNVLVDGEGRVRLLDFGIAKLVDTAALDAGDDGPRTREGQLPMTREYAAPEQLAGGAISVSIDVYQLGLMLFELLSGRAPWTFWRTDPSQVARRLPPPSKAALQGDEADRQRAPRLRGNLDAIVACATAVDPGERYPVVQSLVRDIRSHLRGGRVSARSEGLLAATWRLARGNRIATATLLLLVASLAGWLVTQQQHTAQLERERRALARETLSARQAKTFLLDILHRSDPLAQSEPDPRDGIAWRWLPQMEADARRTLGDSPAVLAEILENMGLLYRRASRPADAERILREAAGLLPAGHAARGRIQSELASLLVEEGRPDEGRRLLELALTHLDAIAARQPDVAVAMLLDAAVSLGALGEHQARLGHVRRALALLARPGHEAPASEAEARLHLAGALGALGRTEAALVESGLALERAEASLGPTHGRLVAVLSRHAELLRTLGRAPEAEVALKRALDIQLAWDVPDSRTVLSLRNNLALALGEGGKRREEQDELRLLARLRSQVLGADSIEVGRVMQNLGASLAKTGDNVGARQALVEADRIFSLALPAGHPQRAFPHITLALVHLQANAPAQAQAAATTAAAMLGKLPDTHFAHAVVGCLRAEARYRQAPGEETLLALGDAADRLATDPAAPADYRQRCTLAARAPSSTIRSTPP